MLQTSPHAFRVRRSLGAASILLETHRRHLTEIPLNCKVVPLLPETIESYDAMF